MSRPDFPHCIMTPGMINHIRQEQDYYDADPDRYERQQEERRQDYLREQEEEERACQEHQRQLEHERQMRVDYEQYLREQEETEQP